jgi:superfamily II DNA or RNA helicase
VRIPRKWQRRALERIQSIISQAIDKALIAACPGAGKTLLAAYILDLLFKSGVICIVIVVPSKALKRQWHKALREVGLDSVHDVDNSTLDERRYRGDDMFDPLRPVNIVTYAQVASNPEIFTTLCDRHRTAVVLDEVHHADDKEEFGKSLIAAFSGAVFKLSLSGTPFNTKGGCLAFCNTKVEINDDGKQERITIPDFDYSYGEAIGAEGTDDDPKVVRQVEFVRWKGTAWGEYHDRITGGVKTKIFNGKKADPLGPLLDPNEPNLRKMVKEALLKLEEIRKHQSNAGMLITAQDSDHCEAIASYLRSDLGVRDCVVVKFDVPQVHSIIERFEKSSDRVLIAIKMVSEGVDIKRLRVGVYASNVLTAMFFLQFVGRFVRWDDAIEWGQISFIYVPYHEVLIEFAERVEKMITDAIIPDPGEGAPPGEERYNKIDGGADGEADGVIARGITTQEDEARRLEELAKKAGIAVGRYTVDDIRAIESIIKTGPSFSVAPSMPDEPLTSKKNDEMVGRIVSVANRVGAPGYDFDKVNTAANRHVGIARKDKLTSEPILVKRLQFLKGMLANLFAMGKGGDASPTA